jgi:hypothetical protein
MDHIMSYNFGVDNVNIWSNLKKNKKLNSEYDKLKQIFELVNDLE